MSRCPRAGVPPSRRPRALLATLLTGLLLTVAACNSSSGGAPGTESSADLAAPVTVEHAFGSTTITKRVTRVAVVGYKEQDYYLALGVVPVAIRDWYGNMPNAVWPWAQDKLQGRTPVVLPRTGINYEQIIAAKPDVIVGMSAGLTKDEYDTLTRIAPTIAQPAKDDQWAVSWQQMTKTAGDIVGKRAQADTIVSGLEGRLRQAAQANPQLQGATSVYASGTEGKYYLYSPETTGSQVLRSLGLTMTDEVRKLTENSDQYFILSGERFDLLNAKVAVWSEGLDDPQIVSLLGDPAYSSLPVHQQGRDLFLGKVANGALAFSSVLSLPYVIDNLVPALARAVDGDRSTTSEFSPKN